MIRQKLREFFANKPVLKQMEREFYQQKKNESRWKIIDINKNKESQ